MPTTTRPIHEGLLERSQSLQGLLAPLFASISLFGVYLIVKYLPDLSLQTFLDVYFFLLGSFALSSGASALLRVRPLIARTPCCCCYIQHSMWPDPWLVSPGWRPLASVPAC
jgi:hypothetical protein